MLLAYSFVAFWEPLRPTGSFGFILAAILDAALDAFAVKLESS